MIIHDQAPAPSLNRIVTCEEASKPTTLSDLFLSAGRENSSRPAIRFSNRTVSYAELVQLVDRVQDRLLGGTTASSQLIGVCMERSIDLIVGLLAVLRAGNSFVPLDPRLPSDRLSYLVKDCKPSLIITQRNLTQIFENEAIPFVCIETLLDPDTQFSLRSDGVHPDLGDSTAYVIYTSGSTGLPKGVEIEHKGMINQILWRQERFQITNEDRILQSFSLAFDPAIWEIFGSLSVGACMIISEETFNSSRIAATIREERITILQTVPSTLKRLIDEPEFRASEHLRHVICGGEVLAKEVAERFTDACSATLHNLYGATEASIDATCWTYPAQKDADRVPIGRPIRNVTVEILDIDGNPSPAGVEGEIHIAGAGLARGYFRDRDLTDKKFVFYPLGSADSKRYYKSGDLGRTRQDGAIEFLGRIDRQVKIHGYRVDPSEIESAISRIEFIREAAVTEKSGKSDAPVLVAYVVSDHSDRRDLQQAVRDRVAKELPSYMVPSVVLRLPQLPRSASNKIDYSALPDPDTILDRDQHSDENSGTRSDEIGQELSRIWREAIGIDSFDPDANFFELGGDSAALVFCIVGIETTFCTSVSPGEFFTRSFRQMVGLIENSLGER